MTGTTPNGIRHPDAGTKLVQIGPELAQMAGDIDTLIEEEIGASSPIFQAKAEAAAGPAVAAKLLDLNMVPALRERFRVLDQDATPIMDVAPSGTHLSGAVNVGGTPHAPSPDFRVGVGERMPLWVDPESGDVHIADLIIRASDGFKVADADERVLFDIDKLGIVGTESRRVVILWILGQSNAEGRARPFGPELDPQDPRILMWDWPTSTVTTATVPLSSQQQQTGLSVATVMAREIIANEPVGTTVVIVNAAVGGSGLVSTPVSGQWKWNSTASVPHLAPLAVDALQAARASVATMYPGVPVEVRAAFHQGEADGDGPAYAEEIVTLFAGLRAATGLSDLPIALGGIVPEYITAQPNRAAIRAAHIDTPRRVTRTAYADGIANGGGSANIADIVHYARKGAERLGRDMYAALRRAIANVATSVPVPPQNGTATLIAGQITAAWEPAFCRVTGYIVQHSTDRLTWDTISPLYSLDTTAAFTASTAEWVRIATVNENGTSAYTTPIRPTGA